MPLALLFPIPCSLLMLSLLSSGALALWLDAMGLMPPESQVSVPLFDAPGLVLEVEADEEAESLVEGYLTDLERQGISRQRQGIWLQVGAEKLASHQGTIPRSAASVTKTATTLVALQTWDWQRRWLTEISATGSLVDGVLQGDLVISGGGDRLWVWEDAIASAVVLQELGIEAVAGDLILENQPWLNFEQDADEVGEGLIESFDARRWTPPVERAYGRLAARTPRPQLEIRGEIRVLGEGSADLADESQAQPLTEPPSRRIPLLRQQSLPLLSLLKIMNVYSNNVIADSLAEELGGGAVVARRAAHLAGVPEAEIQLVNGSGLGQENRISPRAAVALLSGIHRRLAAGGLTLADVLPVFGQDGGTMEERGMPKGATVKTGTLWNVSALVGAVPTGDRGLVWFALLNGGDAYTLPFRRQQDQFLQGLQEQWGRTIQPRSLTTSYPESRFGDRDRIEVIADPDFSPNQLAVPYPPTEPP